MKYNINMKKICSFLLICIIFNSNVCANKTFATNQKVTYAKVLSNCLLYKSYQMNDTYDDVYFLVPESYFVTILETINENCYKVQYKNYIGYVKSACLVIASFVPNEKSLDDIKFDIKDTAGTQIWSKPTASLGSVLTTIPAGTKQISYISKVIGDIPYGGESDIWYYVTYTPFENSTNVYEGYVYSENTTNLDEIKLNLEDNPKPLTAEQTNNNSSFNLNSTVKTIIITFITIPIILFFAIILYKIIKKVKENTNKPFFRKNKFNENFVCNNEFNNEQKVSDEFNNFNNNLPNSNLKSQLDNMKSKIYVKQNNAFHTKSNYPPFPEYDEDDDLL